MKTKKAGIFTAMAAALITTVLLVTNCVEPVEQAGLFGQKDPPPAGMAYLKLNLNGSVGRTIYSDTSAVTDLTYFSKFEVDVRASGSSVSGFPVEITDSTDFDDPLTVPPGTYEVDIIAYYYDDTDDVDIAVAYGIDDDVSVATGTGGTANVVLKEIVTGSGTGTFTWNITTGDSYTTALMSLSKISNSSDNGGFTEVSLLTSPTSIAGVAVDSGYYNVLINLTKTGGYQSVTLREVLHLYEGFTANYTRTLPALRVNTYTIYFNFEDGRTDDPVEISITHGQQFSVATTNINISSVLDGETGTLFDGLTVTGWSDTTGGTGNIIASTQPVYEDLYVYAIWPTPASDEDLTVNVTISYSGDTDPDVTATPNSFTLPTTDGLTLSVANGALYSSLSLTDDTDTAVGTAINPVNDAVFTITAETLNTMQKGTHTYTVTGVLTDGGQTVTTSITFTVQ